MKAIRFVFCLFAALMLTTLNGLAAEEEDFKTFLQKFTSSASFQYSRIKFPLKSVKGVYIACPIEQFLIFLGVKNCANDLASGPLI